MLLGHIAHIGYSYGRRPSAMNTLPINQYSPTVREEQHPPYAMEQQWDMQLKPVRYRRRPAWSCLECRRRKVKCDRNQPCQHCAAQSKECIFKTYRDGPPETSRERPRAPTYPIQRPRDPTPSGGPQLVLPSISARGDFLSRPREAPAVRHQGNGEQLNPVSGLSETSRDLLARQLGLEGRQIVLNKTRTLRWSHRSGVAKEFGTLLGLYSRIAGGGEAPQDPETHLLVVRMRELITKCKNAGRAIKAARPSKGNLLPPRRGQADKMVRLYMEFESVFRILHLPSLVAEYEEYWDNIQTAPVDLQLRVLLAVGIGASLYEFDSIEEELAHRNQVHGWIYAAQEWLAVPKKDRLSVGGVQVYCLTILARQVFSVGGDMVWTSMGSLVNMAQQIGLNRDPKYLPEMTVLEAEVRRRIWATVLELTIQAALDSGMPPRISLDEYDTLPPANVNDSEIDENTTSIQEYSSHTFTDTSMQLKLLQSFPTRLNILNQMSSLRANLTYPDALSFGSELIALRRDCSSLMSQRSPFHRNLIDYLLQRFVIPLYCPFASHARQNPLFQHSMTECLDAALSLSHPEEDTKFSLLMIRGGGLFREGMRCATSMVTLALLQEMESDSRTRRIGLQGEMLRDVMKELMHVSIERIRHGETNIKGYMFLSMVMAQVHGKGEKGLVRSATDTLEICWDLLKRMGGEDGQGEDIDIDFEIDFGQFLGFNF